MPSPVHNSMDRPIGSPSIHRLREEKASCVPTVFLKAKQALNLAGNAPAWQPKPGKIDIDPPTFGQLPNLSTELAELLKVLGGHHYDELPVRT